MLRNEIKAIANLVDAEQGATQSDLANQALSFRRIVEMRPGTEQPVVENASRFQVMRGESDVVDTENLRHGLSPAKLNEDTNSARSAECRQAAQIPIVHQRRACWHKGGIPLISIK